MTLLFNVMEPSQDMIDLILEELEDFEPYVHSVSRSGDSVYIQFNNLPQGHTHKLRISDHEERTTYGYKWQLRLDGVPPRDEQKEFCKYFDNAEKLVTAFRSYYGKVGSDTFYGKPNNTWGA